MAILALVAAEIAFHGMHMKAPRASTTAQVLTVAHATLGDMPGQDEADESCRLLYGTGGSPAAECGR
ncbi:hypothetical protein [Paraburkholderia sp. 40]|uniref:hypothetical protein n=1 Tax=unclassified Paraburkholderia TaxID=2615204 RepID=UPI003D22D35D